MATVTWAHFAIISDKRGEAIFSLALTVFLALVFTAFQGMEYWEAQFTIADSVYGSTFFMATGLFLKGPKNLYSSTVGHITRCGFSNDLNIKSPYWITGFCDAESYFTIKIGKRQNRNFPWFIIPEFGIELHEKDSVLLERIKTFFGVGTILHRVRNGQPSVIYSVQSITDIKSVILPHFKTYPMLTQKQGDLELFSQIIDLMVNKEHLNLNGFYKILTIKASINKGLSNKLKLAFPNIIPVSRPLINNQIIISPYWLLGFVDGEGCFYIKITKSVSNPQVTLVFTISQHSRDVGLLNIIKQYLDCGLIETISTRPNQSTYVVYKQLDILEKIIPFFNTYTLLGIKLLNYQVFCKAAQLVKDKEHLTYMGREKLKNLKSGMNTGRKY